MRNLRWQLVIALGGLLLVVGLLLGQTPDPTVATIQPVPGGVYSEALIGQIVRLNPLLDFQNQVDRDIDRLLYGALIRFDSRGNPVLDLAESYAVSADATLYNFTLREGAVWHDGEPVTSDDVIFTFSKFKEEGYPGPPDLRQVWQEIEIVRLDERNVQFQLPEPFAPFTDFMSTGLLPDHLLRGASAVDLIDHPFNAEPVGSGPFRFERFLQDESGRLAGVSLTAFESYHAGRPYLERVEFRLYPEASLALQAYREELVQGVGTVPPEVLQEAMGLPATNLYSAVGPFTTLVFLNTAHPDKPFLGQKEFRQALLLAINREWLINQLYDGQAVPADGPLLPGSWAFAQNLPQVPYDPRLAESKLDELGWTLPAGSVRGTPEYLRSYEGQSLTFELAYPETGGYAQFAQALQMAWAAIGVQAEAVPFDPASLLPDLLQPRDFQAVLTELDLSRYPDPDPYPFWHDSQVENGQNYSQFSDRNISIWLEQARITPDWQRRAELYRDFQYRFQDQLPALMLLHPVYTYAVSAAVQAPSLGPIQDPSDRFANINEWVLLVRRGFAEPAAAP
jgi:peptide/nickel transport system substrate-binding protein